MRVLLLALLGCGSSPPPSPAPPRANATPLAGEARCRQAVDHLDQLDASRAPDQIQVARVPGAPPAPSEDTTMADCTKRWTTSVVDCVLAATALHAAQDCIPAT